ncbi:enoyl-CoA hydratase/isomerase family protein [Arthrobacter sp. BHU FT2]|nr:enoyl-CoA hydratase/isomerase family protein [Arthrobacter sp. BHU FT2]
MNTLTAAGNLKDEVLFGIEGTAGHIILNRPGSLNALTLNMVNLISETLTRWEGDDRVATVIISGTGPRGLCAGGDIEAIYRDALKGGEATATFWADEYELNLQISRYSKPYVAVMDGIVLGGGVGISAHGAIRVVTERTKIGMPEVGIGFVPDVGGTYLLSRAPGEFGTHAALTAGMFSGADAIAMNLADHFVPAEKVPSLLAALTNLPVEDALPEFAEVPPESVLHSQRDWIDRCYASDDAETIIGRLQDVEHEAAAKAAASILKKSPVAVKVTLEALRRARRLPDLAAVLEQEYRVSLHALASKDLTEGIRAQIIDKDRAPRWSPPNLSQVGQETINSYFTPLGTRELRLPPIPKQKQTIN